MKVVQITPNLSMGDATSNEIVAFRDALKEKGIATDIYADIIKDNIKDAGAIQYDKYRQDKSDLVIYHYAILSRIAEELKRFKGKKAIVYHNVTPPHFYKPFNKDVANICEESLKGIQGLVNKVNFCIAVSNFNKQDLIKMGYTCPIEVLPILIKFEDFEKEPNQEVIDKHSDDYTNIVFTGRVAPNKKHEDLIASFYEYNKYINSKSRLILVGSYGE